MSIKENDAVQLNEDKRFVAQEGSCNVLVNAADKKFQNSSSPLPVTRSIFDLMKEADERDREIERLRKEQVVPNTTVRDISDKVLTIINPYLFVHH